MAGLYWDFLNLAGDACDDPDSDSPEQPLRPGLALPAYDTEELAAATTTTAVDFYPAHFPPIPVLPSQQDASSSSTSDIDAGTHASAADQTAWILAHHQLRNNVVIPQQAVDGERNLDWYSEQLRYISSLVQHGLLSSAVVPLRVVSWDLLRSVQRLGLHADNPASKDEHLTFWTEFNNLWLAALQRQYSLTEDLISSGQLADANSRLMTVQDLEQLCEELVTNCDRVEKYGLVDYEMGVAEERIIEVLMRCLKLVQWRKR